MKRPLEELGFRLMSDDTFARLQRELLSTPQQRADAQLGFQGLLNLTATQRHEVDAERLQVRRQQEEVQAERAAAQQEADRRQAELEAMCEAIERHQAEAEAAETRARDQRARLRAKQVEIDAAEAALRRNESDAQTRLTALQSQKQQLQRDVHTARDEHGRTSQQLERLKRELVERETSDLRRQPRGLQKHELRPHGGDVAEYLAVVDRVEKYVQSDHNNPIRTFHPPAPEPLPPSAHAQSRPTFLPACSARTDVIKIEKVFNRALEEKFLAAKASKLCCPSRDCVVMQLFHGTGLAGVQGIPETGFQLPERSKKKMFGQGIYFATDSSKSAQQMYTKGSNCLLLCDVLLGRSCCVKGVPSDHPLKRHVKSAASGWRYLDVDRASVREAGFDSVFAPRNTKDVGGVSFDEHIVYDPDQAVPRYIVHFGKYAHSVSRPQLGLGNTFARYELVPSRNFDPNNQMDMHFRIAESHFMRTCMFDGPAQDDQPRRLAKVEYFVSPQLVKAFDAQKARFKASGISDKMVLAFHATKQRAAVESIVKTNFDAARIASAHDPGWWGRGFYFSEFPKTSLQYAGGTSNLLLCWLLPGKVYDVRADVDGPPGQPSRTLYGQPLKAGFNSHRLQKNAQGYGQELVIDNPDQVLPCYVLQVE